MGRGNKVKTQYLQYLIEISKVGSLTAAAERLFITQQSLGSIIKRIEDEVGVSILTRTKKGVQFTAEGKIVLAYAYKILDDYDNMLADISKMKDEYYDLQGELSIYLSPVFSNTGYHEMIYAFMKKYPQVKVHSYVNDVGVVYQILSEEKNEKIVCLLNLPYDFNEKSVPEDFLPPTGYKIIPKFGFMYKALVSRRSPLAKYKSISLKTLLKQPLIILASAEATMNTAMCYWLNQYGYEYNIYASTPFHDIWVSMVADNKGVTLSTDSLNDLMSNQNVALIDLEEKIAACNCLVVREKATDVERAFLTFAQKYIKTNIHETFEDRALE